LVTALELQVCAWALQISCLSSLNPASIFQRALDLDDLRNGQGQVGGHQGDPMGAPVDPDHAHWQRRVLSITVCSAAGCGRRAAMLYIGSTGLFACRHGCSLADDCRQECADNRATRRAERIRQRLGWEPGILNRPSRRPKGMHQRTFELLKAQHDVFVNAAVAEMAKRLRLME
jgi:hypothetical protein